MAEIKFEEALAKLEKLVAALEEGSLTLEESLKKYEEGVGLIKECSRMLNQSQKKIKLLGKGKGGKLTARAFKETEEE